MENDSNEEIIEGIKTIKNKRGQKEGNPPEVMREIQRISVAKRVEASKKAKELKEKMAMLAELELDNQLKETDRKLKERLEQSSQLSKPTEPIQVPSKKSKPKIVVEESSDSEQEVVIRKVKKTKPREPLVEQKRQEIVNDLAKNIKKPPTFDERKFQYAVNMFGFESAKKMFDV